MTLRIVVHRWPAVPGGREHDAPRGQVEVGGRRHDRGVVAAQLEQRPAEPGSNSWSDLTAHPRRPGRREQGDRRVVDQRETDRRVAEHHLGDVGREARLDQRPGQQGRGRESAQRRLLGGLPDDRVAADQGDRGVPRPDRDGEVERRDHPDDAERVPGLHQAVAGPLRGHRAPEQLPRQPDGVVADVDHLLHLAARLGGDLADLDGDQRGQVVEVLAQQLAEAPHHRAPHRRGHQPPLVVRRRGPRDRRRHVRGRGPRERGHRQAVDRREADVVAARRVEVDAAGGGRRLGEGSELGLGGESHASEVRRSGVPSGLSSCSCAPAITHRHHGSAASIA